MKINSSRLRRTPIARVLTLMKYINQPRGQTVQVKSDHEDSPIHHLMAKTCKHLMLNRIVNENVCTNKKDVKTWIYHKDKSRCLITCIFE